MKAIRRVCLLLGIVFTFPFYAAGFIFRIGRNWFEFGEAHAKKAEDEWLGVKK